MNYGFFRTACVSLKLKVANPSYNKQEIKKAVDDALKNNARLLVTPELSVTGYTCADLFFNSSLINQAENAVRDIAEYTAGKNIAVIVGAPVPFYNSLYNCAVVIYNGEVCGIVPKINIANYGEFYEKRWFASGVQFKSCRSVNYAGFETKIGNQMFDLGSGAVLGIELCEDLWVSNPPSGLLAGHGANIIANLSASDEYVSKAQYRKELVANQSARCVCAYAYAGASVFESTTDLVFSGASFICENGAVLAQGKRFKRESTIIYADVDIEKINLLRRKNISFENISDGEIGFSLLDIKNDDNDLKYRFVDSHPFVPNENDKRIERCSEIFAIQAAGLAKRLEHVGSEGCVVGISGGLDSTLALLVCAEAMKITGGKNSDIMGITMPGFGTTSRTYNNALRLMREMGVSAKEISIKEACTRHFSDIGHSREMHDITYENTQARERTQILFDMANKHNKLLVGTGDLSELAMGWCTYNGDHMSMYGVNASVPKTLVRYLVEYVASESENGIANVLTDVLGTTVSPELLPPDENGGIAQKTEENIGPYELHDFFLYNFIRFGFTKKKIQFLAEKAFGQKYSPGVISKWLNEFMRRFFISQFKRSCVPDSPKVGSVSLSPRGDWRMPSDAVFKDFTD
ncbi:MAG: NAD(+) synthase [Clostridiales bacterium]|nr:NAD(+) synthase [Clostridiales bacterium]